MTDLAELDRLRDRVAALEEMLGMTVPFPPEWGLKDNEEKLLGLLLKRDLIHREQATAAIWWRRDVSSNMISVYVFHLRRKLKPLGATIESNRGGFYWLTKDVKAKLRELGAVG